MNDLARLVLDTVRADGRKIRTPHCLPESTRCISIPDSSFYDIVNRFHSRNHRLDGNGVDVGGGYVLIRESYVADRAHELDSLWEGLRV